MPSLGPRSFAPTWRWRPSQGRTTPPTLHHGLKVLRGDKRAIFTAAAKAQAAVDWMHAQQDAADRPEQAEQAQAA